MAARRGDWERLKHLLNNEQDAAAAAAPQQVPLSREIVVHVMEADSTLQTVGIDIEKSAAKTPAEAITIARDSVLHVVAYSGDSDEFLQSATVIYGKAKNLLDTRNKKGDTPLHCAARAGRVRMVSHLIALARGKNGAGDDEGVKTILRKQNEQGETVLHDAVRLGNKEMVSVLMSADSQLARVPPADGASPLYLAVSLGHEDIARQLHEEDKALPYSGPDGKNALHVAVLKGKGEYLILFYSTLQCFAKLYI